MFERTKSFIRQVVSKIFPNKNVEKALDINIDISDNMAQGIDLWTKMYEDKAPWIDNDKVKSLNIPSSIASEIARLVTIEMKSEVTGSKRADYLNEQYQKVVDDIRREVEYTAAKGGLIFKPYIDNDKIAVDYVHADNFYPVKFNSSGELIAAIFPEVIKRDKKIYTRLEYHHLLENDVYYISNTAYVKDQNSDELGSKCDLNIVEEWNDLEPEINLNGVENPLFSYIKMPIANTVDSKSNLGVSVYARSVNLIKEIDKHYSRILWEYEGTELAVDVSLDMLKGGTELPEGKDRLFRKLDADSKDSDFYNVFSPEIRDTSLFNGLNKLLQRVEFNCGLAYGTLSDIQVVEKTAEEIKASKQRSYSTIVDIQKQLRIALEHLLYSMDYLASLYNLAPIGEYEVSFDFDDSIIIDNKSEQAIMMQEVAAGLIKPEIYLMRRYGLKEEQAREMLPSMNDDNNPDDGIE